jgi:predicted amidohydrolase
MTDAEEVDSFFDREMPGSETAPLFMEAQRLGIGFYLGFAELERRSDAMRRFNTSVLVDGSGGIAGKYRKIRLPGYAERGVACCRRAICCRCWLRSSTLAAAAQRLGAPHGL